MHKLTTVLATDTWKHTNDYKNVRRIVATNIFDCTKVIKKLGNTYTQPLCARGVQSVVAISVSQAGMFDYKVRLSCVWLFLVCS